MAKIPKGAKVEFESAPAEGVRIPKGAKVEYDGPTPEEAATMTPEGPSRMERFAEYLRSTPARIADTATSTNTVPSSMNGLAGGLLPYASAALDTAPTFLRKAVGGGGDVGDDFDRNLRRLKPLYEAAERAEPVANFVGSVATPSPLGKASIAQRVGGAALLAGVNSATHGGDAMDGAGPAAAIQTGFEAASPVAGRLARGLKSFARGRALSTLSPGKADMGKMQQMGIADEIADDLQKSDAYGWFSNTADVSDRLNRAGGIVDQRGKALGAVVDGLDAASGGTTTQPSAAVDRIRQMVGEQFAPVPAFRAKAAVANREADFIEKMYVKRPSDSSQRGEQIFHGARERIANITDDSPMFFAHDRKSALGYGAVVHETRLPESARLASEQQVISMRPEGSPYNSAWEVLENHKSVRQALEAKGYAGAKFRDMGPDNAYEHPTTVLFRPRTAGVNFLSPSRASAPKAMSLADSENLLKRGYDDEALKHIAAEARGAAPSPRTDAMALVREAIKKQNEDAAEATAGALAPELAGKFAPAKQAFGRMAEAGNIAEKTGGPKAANRYLSPSDYGFGIASGQSFGASPVADLVSKPVAESLTGAIGSMLHNQARTRGSAFMAKATYPAAAVAEAVAGPVSKVAKSSSGLSAYLSVGSPEARSNAVREHTQRTGEEPKDKDDLARSYWLDGT